MRNTSKIVYTCTQCAAQFPKWAGQCSECQAWNTVVEDILSTPSTQRYASMSGVTMGSATVVRLAEVALHAETRFSSGLTELDRILGGGLVAGSVVLMGGDPGIGKSTLLLQASCHMSQRMSALYITGEESLQQVTLRARRLSLPEDKLRVLAEISLERILKIAAQEKPQVLIIDSIQTMLTENLPSAPGSVGQVRECAAQLVRYAKQTGTVLFLIGHVNKEGSLAGPRVLEHMVDTVLYFEGERDGKLRMIRSVKNRYGAVNELGLFVMTDRGLREVNNPSALFLSQSKIPMPGSAVGIIWEGSRPLLVEIQALVDETPLANPRRVTVGLDQNRLSMLLAVLHRHGNIATYQQDVYVNVVGGVKVTETAADLAMVLAVVSSLRDQPISNTVIVLGEVGLAGEIRPVPFGQERLKEAAKHGFTSAIVPAANMPKKKFPEMELHSVSHLREALEIVARPLSDSMSLRKITSA